MDTNALYYTLSTIAQTLAGALAILVAVVLFKFSALKQTMEESRRTFAVRSIDMRQGWPVLRDQGPQAFLDHLGEVQHFSGMGSLTSDIGRNAETIYQTYQDWGRINRRLYITLGATVTDISLCFTALPLTPRITCSPWATGLVIVAAVALGITCLLLSLWLIAAMVKRPE